MNNPASLARGVAPAGPGTRHARSVTGGIRVSPRPGLTIRFGRGERPDTDLAVGDDDLRVSRQHGELTYRGHQWWLRNTGRQLVRLPHGRLMHSSSEPIPLATGYTPLFVKGSGFREHLVELYVTGHDRPGLVPRRQAATLPPKIWPLDDDERLLLIVLGQHYLLYEDGPRTRSSTTRPPAHRATTTSCTTCSEGWAHARRHRQRDHARADRQHRRPGRPSHRRRRRRDLPAYRTDTTDPDARAELAVVPYAARTRRTEAHGGGAADRRRHRCRAARRTGDDTGAELSPERDHR